MGLEGSHSRECEIVFVEGGFNKFDKSEAIVKRSDYPLRVAFARLYVDLFYVVFIGLCVYT